MLYSVLCLCRKQDSPFIAKALGVLSMNKTTELGMVLETCFCTLENWLHTPATSKELSISTVFELAGQLCNSLEVLHNSGYVHGELEPSTVMVSPAIRNLTQVWLYSFSLYAASAGSDPLPVYCKA